MKEQDLDFVSDSKVNMLVKKGQPIFLQGGLPNGLYALYSGKVKIHKTLPSGSDQIIQLMAPGDVFGYKALLCDEPYISSATAIEDSLVCLISNDVFHSIMARSHKLKKDIIFQLSDDLSNAQKKIELGNKSAYARVVDALLSIMSVYGLDEETGELNAKLTRKDLADLSCLTLETTVRTLSTLKKEGVIDFRGKSIFITNKREFINQSALV